VAKIHRSLGNWMRFEGVNIQEMHLIAVVLKLFIVSGTLPPIRRSSVGTEDQDNRFFTQQFRERELVSMDVLQGKVHRKISNFYFVTRG